ncbi:hypothetical protein AOQ84DRAFT_391112 [Glonium stellatum]|uniref:Uncharacterized protein n=1 Tax=Glonium stellatum TaxID=574774 RepID=A0A8E2EUD7_9PEZI|nr:hypothetical protein AOQ84DRAFT_391112 [Glonium stellatum]
MDSLDFAADVAELTRAAIRLGNKLNGLYNQKCPTSKEFQVFGREVKAFSGVWQILQPCLEDSRPFLSPYCMQILSRIRSDTKSILEQVVDFTDNFVLEDRRATRQAEARTRTTFIIWGRRPVNDDRTHRIGRFFTDNDLSVQRGQLLYASTTLQLVLTVINYARTLPKSGVANRVLDNSNLIINEQNKAREEIRKREQRRRNPGVQPPQVRATQWLGKLDLSPSETDASGEVRSSPFGRLANCWVRPERRPGSTVLGDRSDVTDSDSRGTSSYRTIINEPRAENNARAQEMQIQTQQVQNLNHQMQELARQLHDVVRELRDMQSSVTHYRRERAESVRGSDNAKVDSTYSSRQRDEAEQESKRQMPRDRRARQCPPASQRQFSLPPSERGFSRASSRISYNGSIDSGYE